MICILAGCLFLGFLFPQSKKCFFIVSCSAALLLGGYNGELDLVFYRSQFETEFMHPSVFQKLLSAILIVFHKAGLSFEACHFFIAFLSIGMIAFTVYRLTSGSAYAMSIISTFALLETGWQLKAIGAFGTAGLALYWYYEKVYRTEYHRKKNVIIYCLLVFLAMQFHYMAVFFYAFLLIGKVRRKYIIGLVVLADLVLFAGSDILLAAAAKYFHSLVTYLEPMSLFSTIVTTVWQLIFTGFVVVSYKKDRDGRLGDFVMDGSVILLLIIPMYRYTVVAGRIFRIWIIFIAVLMSFLKRERAVVSVRRLCFDVYNAASFLYWFVLIMVYKGTSPLIMELLVHNIFYDLI